MAGIIAHLIIAREIQKLLPEDTIKEEALFYAGSIAPDAIHAREGFVRADKKHTHLRDDIPDKDFTEKAYLDLFHQRVAGFILNNRERQDGLLDVYRGYVVHILTDELYIQTLRQDYVEVMKSLGISQNDIEFFHNIVADMHRVDFQLAEHYPEMDEIKLQLERVKPFEIESLLSESELNHSREWVLKRFFYDTKELEDPIYISYDSTMEFIKMATDTIVDRLSEGGSLPSMFY